MAKKSSSVKVVIKSLGKRSGNVSAPALAKVVRDARVKFVVKKGVTLKIKDTATGSGHIGFHTAKEKPDKLKARIAA